MNINIGQKVVMRHFDSDAKTFGTYVGSALVQRDDEAGIEHMAIIKLDWEHQGYLHPVNGTPNSFIQFIVVHPDNLDVVSEE